MRTCYRFVLGWLAICLVSRSAADVPIEGFLPFVGMALTSEFEDSTLPNASPTFFIAQPSNQPGGQIPGAGDQHLFRHGIVGHRRSHAHPDGRGDDGISTSSRKDSMERNIRRLAVPPD